MERRYTSTEGEHAHSGARPCGILLLTLCRWCSVNAAGTCEYKVNEKAVTQEAYIKKLESLNILSKARNFLVFQV